MGACEGSVRRGLLFHFSVLEAWRKATTRASGTFNHGQGEGLWNQEGSKRFPGFWDGIEFDGVKTVGALVVFGGNEEDFSAAAIAFLGEFDSKWGGVAEGEDDGEVEGINVEVRTVAKSGASVGCGAVAGHLADGQSGHDGGAIGATAANDFGVDGAPAK